MWAVFRCGVAWLHATMHFTFYSKQPAWATSMSGQATTCHDLRLNVSQCFAQTGGRCISTFFHLLNVNLRGTLSFFACPIKQWGTLNCPDWRLTGSVRSTSCLAEPVPRGLKMESSGATTCHLDRVDLGAGLSARTAECIKCCITTLKYSFQL